MSDRCAKSLDLIQANFNVSHVYTDLFEQCAGIPCLNHADRTEGCGHFEGSVAVCGTVCAPYSSQRAKRWQGGSIKAHPDHELTAETLVQWLYLLSPPCGVVENVMGWNMPTSTEDRTTPLERCSALCIFMMMCCTVEGLGWCSQLGFVCFVAGSWALSITYRNGPSGVPHFLCGDGLEDLGDSFAAKDLLMKHVEFCSTVAALWLGCVRWSEQVQAL